MSSSFDSTQAQVPEVVAMSPPGGTETDEALAETVQPAKVMRIGSMIKQLLDEVHQALGAGVDIIMLDNLSDDEMREALLRIRGRTRVEVSGGMTLDRVRALATIGADCVSVGALTHSAPAADISFEIDTTDREHR